MKNDLLAWKAEEISAELYMLDTFNGVMENHIRNALMADATTEFANTILSCLSMQSAKIKEIIAYVEKLADEVRAKSENIDIELVSKVFRGELPESALDGETASETTAGQFRQVKKV